MKQDTEKRTLKMTINKEENMLEFENNKKSKSEMKGVILPIITGRKPEREQTKEVLKKVTKRDLAYLKDKKEEIQKLEKEMNKLREIAELKLSRILSATSLIVGEPVSQKEMKAKFGNKREKCLIEYIAANDEYIKVRDRLSDIRRRLTKYINGEIFLDLECDLKSLEFANSIFLVKFILVSRYAYFKSHLNIAESLNLSRITFFDNFKKII